MTLLPPEEIGAKMHALKLWGRIAPFNWVVKPTGTVFPYFCTLIEVPQPNPVLCRFLMIEGWQTFHDYVFTRADRNYGVYSTPMELPHFELVVLATGEVKVFRHDAGYVPRELSAQEKTLVSRIMWEAYGVMMRIESDDRLPLRYSSEKAMFARVETAKGVWEDAPMPIVPPNPFVEKVSFAKADIDRAKDIPFATEETLEVDFRIFPNLITQEPRPRYAYILVAVDAETGEKVVFDKVSVSRDGGLKALWESMPPRLLKNLIARGRIPGNIRLLSGRVFRMLRPLCVELPFKISLHDSLPRLEQALKV